jgi:HSP20 family protein
MGTFPAMDRNFGFPALFSETMDRLWADEDVNWMPSANIKERANDFKIDLAVPGMDKKDFKIEMENSVLTISGERKDEKLEENEKMTRREFHYGSFKRSFTLPETVNAEDIKANYNDGVLSLVIAKREEEKEKGKKQIEIA